MTCKGQICLLKKCAVKSCSLFEKVMNFVKFLNNFSTKIKALNSRHPNAFFILKFAVAFVISYHINIQNHQTTADISSGKNLLHYVMRHFTFAGRFLVMIIFFAEEFFNRKNTEKINFESLKIKKSLNQEFLFKISSKKLAKINKKRKLLILFEVFLHESIYFVKNVQNVVQFIIFVARVGRTFVNCFIIYRFCYFVDFINLHLLALLKIVDEKYLESTKNEKLALKKILAVRKCYIYIINMQKYFLISVKWTTFIHFVTMMLSIIRRLYKLYTVMQGELPLKESACKFLI